MVMVRRVRSLHSRGHEGLQKGAGQAEADTMSSLKVC